MKKKKKNVVAVPVIAPEKYEKARKKVEDIKGFYVHLTVYVVVNAFLLAINLLTEPQELWFYWSAIFWGIGVIVHFLGVFFVDDITRSWEEKKIKQLLEQEEKKENN